MAALTGRLEDALDLSIRRLPTDARARAASVKRLSAVCTGIAQLASTAALLSEQVEAKEYGSPRM